MLTSIFEILRKYKRFWRAAALLSFVVYVGYVWWKKPAREASGPLRKTYDLIDDTKPLRFLVVGDTGSGSDAQYFVAEALEERCKQHDYQGLILLGDNFYMHGVDSVTDPQWDSKMFRPYGSPCLSKLVIYAILGNHDYQGNPDAQIKMHRLNKRFYMPRRFYSVDFGKTVKFVMADSNFPDRCYMDDSCMIDFVDSELENSSSSWNIVLAHHPFETSSKKYPNPKFAYRFLFRDSICQGQADVYFSGHSHHLEHRKPSDTCKSDLIVSGAGGAGLYALSKNYDPSKVYAKTNTPTCHV